MQNSEKGQSQKKSTLFVYQVVLLPLVIAVFLGSLGYSLFSLRVGQTEIRGGSIENPLWSAAQLDTEYWRFRSAFTHFVTRTGVVSQDEFLTRLDVLWSRINVYSSDSFAWQYLRKPELAINTLDALRQILTEYDERLISLKPGDLILLAELDIQLDELSPRIRDLVVTTNFDLVKFLQSRRNVWVDSFDKIMMLMFSTIIGGLALIYFLYRQIIQIRLLATKATEAEQSMREAKDQADNANQSKSHFLASMSHELRTPLHGILSFSELGLKRFKSLSPEKLKLYFDNINISGNRLLHLINDLLDISKLSAGQMVLEYNDTDIDQIWRRAIRELQPLLDEKSIQLDYQLKIDDTFCTCDQHRMLQVISNIVSNAIKFSPKHAIISGVVKASQLDYDDARSVPALSVAISDEGQGVEAGDLESIFEKFIQARKPPHSAQGTGLGLAICKEIITLHQGRIHAENRSEGGARFVFTIPRTQSANTSLPEPGREHSSN